MRSKDKPFVVYRRRDFFTFVPQGPRGWIHLAIWLSLIAPFAAWLVDHLQSLPHQEDASGVIVLFLAMVAIWITGGIWWLFSHAQIIDHVVMQRDQQLKERKKRRPTR